MEESDSHESFPARRRDRAERILCFDDGVANPENVLTGFGATDEFLYHFDFGNDRRTQSDGLAIRPFRGDGGWCGVAGRSAGDERIVGRRRRFLDARSRYQFASPFRSECRAEDDHGTAEVHQFPDQRGDERAGVDVVGVNLVKDDDFPGQGEATDEEVFHRHDGLQRLIDCADAVGGEQRLLGRGEPRTRLADVFVRILAILFPPQRE